LRYRHPAALKSESNSDLQVSAIATTHACLIMH